MIPSYFLEWKLELSIYLSYIQARIPIYNGGQTKGKNEPVYDREELGC